MSIKIDLTLASNEIKKLPSIDKSLMHTEIAQKHGNRKCLCDMDSLHFVLSTKK